MNNRNQINLSDVVADSPTQVAALARHLLSRIMLRKPKVCATDYRSGIRPSQFGSLPLLSVFSLTKVDISGVSENLNRLCQGDVFTWDVAYARLRVRYHNLMLTRANVETIQVQDA